MMRRLSLAPALLSGSLLSASLLAACAGAPPPPGAQVDAQRFAAAVVPGQSTRASVLAALGSTRKVVFDSGFETWLYQVPRGGGRFAEYVILFDRTGIVSKTRIREPLPTDKI